MPLRAQLEACLKSFPGCIGAGYIDLESGLPLTVVANPEMDEDTRNLLAVAAVQVMNSASVAELGEVLMPEAEDRPAFRETVVMSEETIHIFERMEKYPNETVCLIFRIDADPAEILRAARSSLSQLSLAGFA